MPARLPLSFKKLMGGRFLYTFGSQMQSIVIGWQMYELTHDALYLGFIGLAEAIPALGLALLAGYIVDRSRPIFIYRGVVFCSLISGGVLYLSQFESLHFSSASQVLMLFAASFITGVARGFSQPSVFALVPRLVPRDEISKASAWMASSMQIARISGPAIGGLVFGWLGVGPSALTVCASLALAQIVLVGMPNTNPSGQTKEQAQGSKRSLNIRKELFSGLSFVFNHPILLPALTLDMITVFFGGVTAMLPIYAADILHTGPRGLGILRASPAIGATIMSLLLTRFAIREYAGRWLFVAVTGFGFCMLAFGLSDVFIVSAVALVLGGAFDSISMVIRSSAVQLASPDAMRGRISAVNSVFIGSSNELGEFESGVAARLLGTVPSVIFGAGVCLLTVATAFVFSPALRNLNLYKLEADNKV